MKKIWIVGMGMGGPGQITQEGLNCLSQAEAIMGAGRLLECARKYGPRQAAWLDSYRPEEMVRWLENRSWSRAVLAVSGDPGFYSLSQKAAQAFANQGWQTETIPGISSLSFLAACLGKAWDQAAVCSCHGRRADTAAWVRSHKLSFFLLGGETGPKQLCESLVQAGLDHCQVWTGENLSYENQRIRQGSPSQLADSYEQEPFQGVCCAMVENPSPSLVQGAVLPVWGLGDQEFIRGKVPMTKSEVRAVSLSKLALWPGAVCWDIGSGTGSVSVEMGLALKQAGSGQVYAIEQKQEALELTRENQARFLGDWPGFHLVEGRAPEILKDLPAPTHVFIGGSGGQLEAILGTILKANPRARIVANAITLETVAQLTACRRRFGFQVWELVQVWAAPIIKAGPYHMPQAGNPVYVALMGEAREDRL